MDALRRSLVDQKAVSPGHEQSGSDRIRIKGPQWFPMACRLNNLVPRTSVGLWASRKLYQAHSHISYAREVPSRVRTGHREKRVTRDW